MNRTARWAVGVLLVVTLAACGTPTQPSAPVEPQGPPVITVAPLPVRLVIPSIGVDSSDFISVGLDENHELKTPTLDQPGAIAWYAASPSPGDRPNCAYSEGCVQSAVLDGHINANGVQGVFAKLAKLKKGAKLAVARNDGKTAHFTVTKVMIFKKDQFPTDLIYGDNTSALVMITCGPGDLVRTAAGGNYLQQTAVKAALTSITPTS